LASQFRAPRITGPSGAHPALLGTCNVMGWAAEAYLLPNIPGMEGIPILPPPAIFFIIFCISRN